MLRRFITPIAATGLALGLAACSGTGTASAPPTASMPPLTSAAPSGPSGPSASTPAASPSAVGDSVTVTGTDYAYAGVPPTTPAGTTFGFVNEGGEVHEMTIVRKNDGVTRTFDELLALPEDEAMSQVTFVGAAIAGPAETAPTTLTVAEPGEYLMVCFIPQGTTSLPSLDPNASAPPTGLGDGPPHFTLGMAAEFTVQ
jgi:plastocyanin